MKQAFILLLLTAHIAGIEPRMLEKLVQQNDRELEPLRDERIQAKMYFWYGAFLLATATATAYVTSSHVAHNQSEAAMKSSLMNLSLNHLICGFSIMNISTYNYFKNKAPFENAVMTRRHLKAHDRA